MTRAAKSLYVFGIYLGGLGLALLLVPNALLRAFGAPPTNEIWIRVNGKGSSLLEGFTLSFGSFKHPN